MTEDFSYRFATCPPNDPHNDNVDIFVTLHDGKKYNSTFYTLDNVHSLFHKAFMTGEYGSGSYFSANYFVIVRSLENENIVRVIEALLQTGDFFDVFVEMKGNESESSEGVST